MKHTFLYVLGASFCLFIFLLPTNKAFAGTITDSEPLGGFSKAISDYCAKGGTMEEIHSFLYKYDISETDRSILERIVEAEATGGTFEQKQNVASCVLARVYSNEFPNNVESVVFQHNSSTYQFAPIKDGRYFTVTITDSTREAVEDILLNGMRHHYLYFCADCESYRHGWFSTLKEYAFDGMHHWFTGVAK